MSHTKERAERLLSMTKGQLVLECQDLCQQRDSLQAEVDRLMLEFCPRKMTSNQIANWAKHQIANVKGTKNEY